MPRHGTPMTEEQLEADFWADYYRNGRHGGPSTGRHTA